jgi:hypothetical protein
LDSIKDIENEPIYKAFKDAGLNPGGGGLKNWLPFAYVPRDTPLIFVGEKYMYYSKRPYFGDAFKAAPSPK